MLRILFYISILLYSGWLVAQNGVDKSTTSTRRDSLGHHKRILNSLGTKKQSVLDSVNRLKQLSKQQFDTLNKKYKQISTKWIDKKDSLQQLKKHLNDSLMVKNRQKIQSLKEKITKSQSSLKDSLRQAVHLEKVQHFKEKIEKHINLDSLSSGLKLSQELSEHKEKLMNQKNKVEEHLKISEGKEQFNKWKQRLNKEKNHLKKLDTLKQKIAEHEVNQYINDAKENTRRYKQKIAEHTEKVKEINNQVAVLKDSTARKEAMKKIAEEKLNQQVQKFTSKQTNVQLPSSSENPANILKSQLSNYEGQYANEMQNKEAVLKKIKSQIDGLGKDQIKQAKKRVKKAHQKIEKYKQKYQSLENLKAAKGLPSNPLKDKSLAERLIYSGNFQINHADPITLDISGQVSYRIIPRWSIGIGSSYKMGFYIKNEKFEQVKSESYGGRLLSDVRIWKGFFAHAEYERSIHLKSEMANKQVINTGYVGVMKKFSISDFVAGHMQLLYNIVSDDPSRPNQNKLSRWVYRFGIDVFGHKRNIGN